MSRSGSLEYANYSDVQRANNPGCCVWAIQERVEYMSGLSRMTNGTLRVPLGLAKKGFSGQIEALSTSEALSAIPAVEIERRLIELGFVEGARVEILHEGL